MLTSGAPHMAVLLTAKTATSFPKHSEEVATGASTGSETQTTQLLIGRRSLVQKRCHTFLDAEGTTIRCLGNRRHPQRRNRRQLLPVQLAQEANVEERSGQALLYAQLAMSARIFQTKCTTASQILPIRALHQPLQRLRTPQLQQLVSSGISVEVCISTPSSIPVGEN